jgi:hypothetical protein
MNKFSESGDAQSVFNPRISPAATGALSINDFCNAYGIGRTLAYAEIKAGALKPVKIGRRTLIPVTAAADWLARKSAT